MKYLDFTKENLYYIRTLLTERIRNLPIMKELHHTNKYKVTSTIGNDWIMVFEFNTSRHRLLTNGAAKLFIEHLRELLHYQPAGKVNTCIDEYCHHYFVTKKESESA